MKLIVKHFKDGSTFRVEGGDKAARAKLAAQVRRWMKDECSSETVNTFDAPLPQCGPGEPGC